MTEPDTVIAGVDLSWDPDYELITINGPTAFTQLSMTRREAQGVADALGLPLTVRHEIVGG